MSQEGGRTTYEVELLCISFNFFTFLGCYGSPRSDLTELLATIKMPLIFPRSFTINRFFFLRSFFFVFNIFSILKKITEIVPFFPVQPIDSIYKGHLLIQEITTFSNVLFRLTQSSNLFRLMVTLKSRQKKDVYPLTR